MSDEFELPPDQRSALAALSREGILATDIEERTVRALRARGLLRTKMAHTAQWTAAAAAAVLFFVAGFEIGRRAAASAPDSTLPVPSAAQADTATRVVAWF